MMPTYGLADIPLNQESTTLFIQRPRTFQHSHEMNQIPFYWELIITQ